MSLTDRTTLKSYFVTGAVPTQAQFADLIDACLIPDAEGRVGLGTTTPSHRLEVAGTVSATAFAGSGASLTNLPAGNLVGELSAAQLPQIPAAQVTGTLGLAQLPTIPPSQIGGVLQPTQIPPLSQLEGVITADQLPPDLRPGALKPSATSATRLDFPSGGFVASANATVQVAPSGSFSTPDQVFTPNPSFAFPLQFGPNQTATCRGLIAIGQPGNLTVVQASFLLPAQVQQPGGPGLPQAQLTVVNRPAGTPMLPKAGMLPLFGQWSTGIPMPGMPLARYDLTFALPTFAVAPHQSFGLLVTLTLDQSGRSVPKPGILALCPKGQPNTLGCSTYIQSANLPGRSLFLTTSGAVGVGTAAPAMKLDVAGAVRAAGFHNVSDAQLKTSIQPLTDALRSIIALRPVRFHWLASAFGDAPDPGAQIGLIAQAVEAVLPELVQTDPDGIKSVDYSGLAPVLAGAIHELADQNAALLRRLQSLEERLVRLAPSEPAP